jgi:hypothetical protein
MHSPVIPEVPHRETKAFHLGNKIVINNPPLPNVMNISVFTPVLVLGSRVNLVHFCAHRFVGFFILRMWDVSEIFFFSEIKKPDGTLRGNKLWIEN